MSQLARMGGVRATQEKASLHPSKKQEQRETTLRTSEAKEQFR